MNSISKKTARTFLQALRDFAVSRDGFAGVEKALLLFVALGLVLAVGGSVGKATGKKTEQIAKLLGG